MFHLAPSWSPRRHRSRFVAGVVLVAFGLVVNLPGPSWAQAPTPPQPERVGTDAPRQERNPTQRPQAYLLRQAPAPVAEVDTGTVKVKLGGELPPNLAAKKKRRRGGRRVAAAPERMVPVRKALPVGPTPEEVAAEREARRAEMRRPAPIGSDAPHYERNADPDVSAARIISIERP